MSANQKKRALVVCPGRGTYTKETLGYLKNYGGTIREQIQFMDEMRADLGEPTITELDSAETFKATLHTKGEHASPLIYAWSLADFHSINRDKFDICAVAGNSMGWYITLAVSGALSPEGAFNVINTMGSMMKSEIIGGQVIYPLVDEAWKKNPSREREIDGIVEKLKQQDGVQIHTSINLGGYIVWGANKAGVQALLKGLPQVENYPFQLINHAAFHTPLLQETSNNAFGLLPQDLFQKPQIPMVDGRGVIWSPYSTSVEQLYSYTLDHQVVAPYDFTKSISVALKEFAPDCIILLGPGSSLGGSLGQILIENDWQFLNSKNAFSERQKNDPFILAMGRPEQRALVV